MSIQFEDPAQRIGPYSFAFISTKNETNKTIEKMNRHHPAVYVKDRIGCAVRESPQVYFRVCFSEDVGSHSDN